MKSSEKLILEFGFYAIDNAGLESDYIAVITQNHIEIKMPNTVNVTTLIARFKLSDKATAFVGGSLQKSSMTANDFSALVEYEIMAEDGSKSKFTIETTLFVIGLAWKKTSEFPGIERSEAICFAINGKFYLGLGIQDFGSDPELSDLYEYDPATNLWSQKTDFPIQGWRSIFSFSIDGKGYIGLDSASATCDPDCAEKIALWEYDPESDSWRMAVNIQEFLPLHPYYRRTGVVNGKGYIFDENSTAGILEYDPIANKVTQFGVHEINAPFSSSFEIDDRIYFTTGGNDPNFSIAVKEFKPSIGNWIRKNDFPGRQRRFASGFTLDGAGYVTSGEGTIEIAPGTKQYVGIRDTWKYTPSTDSWEQINDFPGNGLIYQIACASERHVIVGAGKGPGNFSQKDFWIAGK